MRQYTDTCHRRIALSDGYDDGGAGHLPRGGTATFPPWAERGKESDRILHASHPPDEVTERVGAEPMNDPYNVRTLLLTGEAAGEHV